MPTVIFVQADGTRQRFDAAVGESVMDCALDNLVPGIIAQCGGGCTCSTCHVYVEAPWLARLPPQIEDEAELLTYVETSRTTSRLSCQIFLTEDLDGIVVNIPEEQV